jgi:hypothetical protein
MPFARRTRSSGHHGLKKSLTAVFVGAAICGSGCEASAQTKPLPTPEPSRIALKDGETFELGAAFYVVDCKSTAIGQPQVEILEGPPGVTLAIREGMVAARSSGCANKVPGGTLTATAKGIKEATVSRLIYRIKYKTQDGDRQKAGFYFIALVP